MQANQQHERRLQGRRKTKRRDQPLRHSGHIKHMKGRGMVRPAPLQRAFPRPLTPVHPFTPLLFSA